mmetsp:Transcript_56150/g.47346  ORF Transcript_56150/g.47346 Transcript_56150/m.47346 type:complete len:244 (-) Transcript_56150:282-1013(-)
MQSHIGCNPPHSSTVKKCKHQSATNGTCTAQPSAGAREVIAKFLARLPLQSGGAMCLCMSCRSQRAHEHPNVSVCSIGYLMLALGTKSTNNTCYSGRSEGADGTLLALTANNSRRTHGPLFTLGAGLAGLPIGAWTSGHAVGAVEAVLAWHTCRASSSTRSNDTRHPLNTAIKLHSLRGHLRQDLLRLRLDPPPQLRHARADAVSARLCPVQRALQSLLLLLLRLDLLLLVSELRFIILARLY